MSLSALQRDCKTILENIRHLNNDELDAIMSDDAKLQELLHNLDQSYLKDIALDKDTIISHNQKLAEENLTREPELVEGREKIEELSTDGEELSNRVKEKYDQIRSQSGDVSLETMLALLQTAASEIEEQSDKMAEKFLSGEVDLDDFIDQFLAARKSMHLRHVKAEKMTKLLERDPILGGSNYMNLPPMGMNTNYYPQIPQNRLPPAVPYPMGPLNMPMPGINYSANHY